MSNATSWGSHNPNVMGHATLSTVARSLLLGLAGSFLLAGCASPQQRQAKADWKILCDQAPYGPGQELSAKEQRAMTRVGAWEMSVEAINARCGY